MAIIPSQNDLGKLTADGELLFIINGDEKDREWPRLAYIPYQGGYAFYKDTLKNLAEIHVDKVRFGQHPDSPAIDTDTVTNLAKFDFTAIPSNNYVWMFDELSGKWEPKEITASSLDLTAGQVISALKGITIDTSTGKGIYADSATITHANRIVGISYTSAAQDGTFTVYTGGEMTDVSWTWDLTKSIFLGTSGSLTQTAPTSGQRTIMGFPLSATSMKIKISESILLG